MTTRRRRRHCPEQIVRKLRDADAMLNAGQDLAAVLQALEVSEATYHRWRNQYGGMKSEEARRLKSLEDENKRLKQIVADQALDLQMLRHVASETGRPFAQACGDRRASGTVRGLRAKGLCGAGAAAQYAALPGEAAVGGGGAVPPAAGDCAASSAVWLPAADGGAAEGGL